MSAYVLTHLAKADVFDIWSTIAENNEEAADRVEQAIYDACAFVAEALTLGELVTLEVPLSDSEKHAIPARVVRALGTEYGFQFTALSAEQRLQIQVALIGQPVIPYYGN